MGISKLILGAISELIHTLVACKAGKSYTDGVGRFSRNTTMGLLDEYDKNPRAAPVKPLSPAPTDGGDDFEELPGIIRWLARHSGGLVKTRIHITYVLIIVIIIALILSFSYLS